MTYGKLDAAAALEQALGIEAGLSDLIQRLDNNDPNLAPVITLLQQVAHLRGDAVRACHREVVVLRGEIALAPDANMAVVHNRLRGLIEGDPGLFLDHRLFTVARLARVLFPYKEGSAFAEGAE